MRNRVLLFIALIIAALQAQAAVITASVEQVDFGPVEIGYPVSMQFTVTGSDLTGDIDLTLDGRHTHFYQVTPAVITPEAAGSSVPACPTRRSPNARRTRLTTSWLERPTGLLMASRQLSPLAWRLTRHQAAL